MPTKKGAGGRQQFYDSRGRYAKLVIEAPHLYKKSRKERASQKELLRREILYNRAKKSKDTFLFEVFQEIEKEMPGEILAVNEKRYDEGIKANREFDIISKRSIIEI